MEFQIKSFYEKKNFIIIGVIEIKDARKEAEGMVNGLLMNVPGIDSQKGQIQKNQAVNSFIEMIESADKEVDDYEIPVEKTIFEEMKLKLGQIINIEVSIPKK